MYAKTTQTHNTVVLSLLCINQKKKKKLPYHCSDKTDIQNVNSQETLMKNKLHFTMTVT